MSYSIILFLALVSSGLMIAFNIIGKLYNSIIQCQKNCNADHNGNSDSKNGSKNDDKKDHKNVRNSDRCKSCDSSFNSDRNSGHISGRNNDPYINDRISALYSIPSN